LEVSRIWSGASRDRHGDVAWLDFRAPHHHLLVHVAVTSIPHIVARVTLPDSLALGAQHGKFDADLRTFALLGVPSVHSVHDYNPFAVEDGGMLAPMAVGLVDRLVVLVVVVASLP
jgi:hypothetical protein